MDYRPLTQQINKTGLTGGHVVQRDNHSQPIKSFWDDAEGTDRCMSDIGIREANEAPQLVPNEVLECMECYAETLSFSSSQKHLDLKENHRVHYLTQPVLLYSNKYIYRSDSLEFEKLKNIYCEGEEESFEVIPNLGNSTSKNEEDITKCNEDSLINENDTRQVFNQKSIVSEVYNPGDDFCNLENPNEVIMEINEPEFEDDRIVPQKEPPQKQDDIKSNHEQVKSPPSLDDADEQVKSPPSLDATDEQVKSPPSLDEQVKSPPSLDEQVKSPPSLDEQVKSPPSLDDADEQVKSPPSLDATDEQVKSPPSLDEQVKSPPSLDEQVKSPPSLDDADEQVKSPPSLDEQVKSPPSLDEQVKSPPSLDDADEQVKSPPSLDEQVKSPPSLDATDEQVKRVKKPHDNGDCVISQNMLELKDLSCIQLNSFNPPLLFSFNKPLPLLSKSQLTLKLSEEPSRNTDNTSSISLHTPTTNDQQNLDIHPVKKRKDDKHPTTVDEHDGSIDAIQPMETTNDNQSWTMDGENKTNGSAGISSCYRLKPFSNQDCNDLDDFNLDIDALAIERALRQRFLKELLIPRLPIKLNMSKPKLRLGLSKRKSLQRSAK